MRVQALHAAFNVLLIAATALPAGAQQQTAKSSGDKLIAIDVLLEPDQTMIGKAEAVNARLRRDYPAGYELDATHSPHVTLLQRFVRAKDFDSVTGAVAKVLAAEKPTELQLKAQGLFYALWGGVALTVLVVERTPDLMRLQQKVVDALAPFSVSGGTAAAFIETPPNAEIIRYVETFVPESSGDKYQPHVTAGVASEAFAQKLKAEPFVAFTFHPVGVAIYQLVNFGTASKKLWDGRSRTPLARFGLLVHHDDAAREFAYGRKSIAGKLDLGLDEAPKRGWTLVSMKDDGAQVFCF